MKQVNQDAFDEWQKLKTYAKIYAKKGWYQFKKKTRKLMFVCGVQLISLSGVSAQVVRTPENAPKDYLAKATLVHSNPNYKEFVEQHTQEIEKREEAFARDLWQVMSKNVETLQDAAKKGRKTPALRQMAANYKEKGIAINPRFYCSSAAISSVLETIKENKYPEYEFLVECLSNPNSCPQIIKDLNENYGKKAKTNNVQQTLQDIFQKNPRAVCIAIVESKRNSSSGYHFTMAFPEAIANNKEIDTLRDSNFVVLDTTIIAAKNTSMGKTARFNVDKISDIEDYYTGEKNRGYVFNITEMVENDLIIEMYKERFKKDKERLDEIKGIGVIAQASKPRKKEVLWAQVSHSDNKNLMVKKATTRRLPRG